MFPPEAAAAEDVPLIQRVARWLDWWCTPRWRALLTWVGMAVVTGLVFDSMDLEFRLEITVMRMVEAFGNLTNLPVRGEVSTFFLLANKFVLFFWFEPFALRLNLPRGVQWLALRTGSVAAFIFVPWKLAELNLMLTAVMPMVALIGWRSRPWMAVVGGALTVVWVNIITRTVGLPDGMIRFAIFEIPFAVALLYGTRLLSPEERAERGGGRVEPLA